MKKFEFQHSSFLLISNFYILIFILRIYFFLFVSSSTFFIAAKIVSGSAMRP